MAIFSFEQLRRALSEGVGPVPAVAVRALAGHGPDGIAAIARTLRDGPEEGRKRALQGVAAVAREVPAFARLVPELVPLLHGWEPGPGTDHDDRALWKDLHALSWLDGWLRPVRASRSRSRRDERSRAALAARALAEIGEAALPALRSELRASERARRASALVVLRLGEHTLPLEEVYDDLLILASDPEPLIRLQVIGVVMTDHAAMLPNLRELLRDGARDGRLVALSALMLAPTSGGEIDAARPELERLASSARSEGDPGVRTAAAAVLDRIGKTREGRQAHDAWMAGCWARAEEARAARDRRRAAPGGRGPDVGAIPRLAKAARVFFEDDPDRTELLSVATALGREREDPAGAARLLTEAIHRGRGRMLEGDRDVLIRALRRLGPVAAPAVPVLVDLLRTEQHWAGGMSDALVAIGDPARTALIEAARRARGSGIVFAKVLARIDAAAALPFLLRMIREGDEDAATEAAEEIWRQGQAGSEVIEAFRAALARGRGGTGVRAAALRALVELDAVPREELPALARDLHGDDLRLVRAAAEALGLFGAAASAAAPDLVRCLRDSLSAKWKDEFFGEIGLWMDLIPAVGRIGSAMVPLLRDGLHDPAPRVRALMAWALGAIGREAAAAADDLRALIVPPLDDTTTWHATESLCRIEGWSPALVPGLRAALRDTPSASSLSALELVAAAGPAAAVLAPEVALLAQGDEPVRAAWAEHALARMGIESAAGEVESSIEAVEPAAGEAESSGVGAESSAGDDESSSGDVESSSGDVESREPAGPRVADGEAPEAEWRHLLGRIGHRRAGVATRALHRVAEVAPRASAERLLELLAASRRIPSIDHRARARALALALRGHGDVPAIRAAMNEALGDVRPAIRIAALESLGTWGEAAGDFVDRIVAHLDDRESEPDEDDYAERPTPAQAAVLALTALGRAAATTALPELRTRLDQAMRDGANGGEVGAGQLLSAAASLCRSPAERAELLLGVAERYVDGMTSELLASAAVGLGELGCELEPFVLRVVAVLPVLAGDPATFVPVARALLALGRPAGTPAVPVLHRLVRSGRLHGEGLSMATLLLLQLTPTD